MDFRSEPSGDIRVCLELHSFNLTHEVSMMKAVTVVVPQNASMVD